MDRLATSYGSPTHKERNELHRLRPTTVSGRHMLLSTTFSIIVTGRGTGSNLRHALQFSQVLARERSREVRREPGVPQWSITRERLFCL